MFDWLPFRKIFHITIFSKTFWNLIQKIHSRFITPVRTISMHIYINNYNEHQSIIVINDLCKTRSIHIQVHVLYTDASLFVLMSVCIYIYIYVCVCVCVCVNKNRIIYLCLCCIVVQVCIKCMKRI